MVARRRPRRGCRRPDLREKNEIRRNRGVSDRQRGGSIVPGRRHRDCRRGRRGHLRPGDTDGERGERAAQQQRQRGKETEEAGAAAPGARVRPGGRPCRGSRLARAGQAPGAPHAAGRWAIIHARSGGRCQMPACKPVGSEWNCPGPMPVLARCPLSPPGSGARLRWRRVRMDHRSALRGFSDHCRCIPCAHVCGARWMHSHRSAKDPGG